MSGGWWPSIGGDVQQTLEQLMLSIDAGAKLFYAPDLSGGKILNRLASAATDDNLAPLFSGDFYGNYGGITPYAATGPGGNTTAGTLVIASGGTKYLFDSKVFTAATYTIGCKIKNNVAGSITVKFGVTPGTFVTPSIDNVGWTQVNITFTADGTNPQAVYFKNESGSSFTIQVDEVQFYVGGSLPAYSTAFEDSLRQCYPAKVGLTLSGGAIDTNTNKMQAAFRWPSFPLKTSFSGLTIFFVVKDDDTGQTRCILSTVTANATTNALVLDHGNVYGAPVGTYLKASNYIAAKGYYIAAIRFSTTEQSFFLNGFKIRSTAAKSAVSMAFMQIFGYTSIPDGNIKAKVTMIGAFPSSISDANMSALIPKIKSKHLLTGESAISEVTNVWIAEGDSITAGDVGTPTTYPMQYMRTSVNCFGFVSAVGGSTLTTMNTRLPDVLAMIASAVGTGKRCIVSTFIGANAIPTIADMETYWTACRSAGAYVVACTITPIDSAPGFETSRLAWNTAIRGASAYYDTLLDFGDVGTEMGRYDSRTLHPTWWQDTEHPTTLGHTQLYNEVKSIIDGILL